MVTQLYPRDLDPQSLARSLSDLGTSLRQAGANVEVDVDEHLALDETTATLVYRVARESLHNAEKHAQPRNVDVRLTRARSRTVLTVIDDGRGFEPTAEPAAGHFGLKLIRDTVAEAGGTFLVDSLHRAGNARRAEPASLSPPWRVSPTSHPRFDQFPPRKVEGLPPTLCSVGTRPPPRVSDPAPAVRSTAGAGARPGSSRAVRG